MNVVGRYVTRKIKKAHEKVTYKQDTAEVQQINDCLQTLLTANKLEDRVPFISTKLVHNTHTIS